MRGIGSSMVDPSLATAQAVASLNGSLHGGTTEGVLHVLGGIGGKMHVPAFLKQAKERRGRLMGFPVEMFPVLFSLPRTVEWRSLGEEMMRDEGEKIVGPRQMSLDHEKGDSLVMRSHSVDVSFPGSPRGGSVDPVLCQACSSSVDDEWAFVFLLRI